MNKTKNAIKDLKQKITLNVGPPSECRVCGHTSEQMKEDYEVAWLEHRVPNTNFVFYVCPNCNVCSGNIFATENAKKIRDTRNEPKILQPNNNIIIPGRN